MRYHPYETLVAPARTRPELWRLALGIGLSALLFTLGMAVLTEIIGAVFSIPAWAVTFGLSTSSQPAWTLVMLFSFGLMAIAPMITVRWLHARPGLSLIGPLHRTARDLVRAILAVFVLQLVLEILPPWGAYDITENPQMPFGRWLLFLPLSALGVLIQTGAEEVFFRGYLQSQLAARFRAPIVWMGVPSVLFAIGHYDPATMGDSAVWVTVWALLFGLLAADLTARTGTLGAAIGFHFANNAYAILIVGFPDQLGALALYHLPFTAAELDTSSPLILIDFAAMIVAWLAVRLALRR